MSQSEPTGAIGVDQPSKTLNPQALQRLAAEIAMNGISEVSFRLKVISGSMAPLLKPGDWVIARPMEAGKIRSGDIIIYRRRGEIFTHRVLECNPRMLLTKGDAFRQADPPMMQGWQNADILGVVTVRVRSEVPLDLSSPAWQSAGQKITFLGKLQNRWRSLPLVGKLLKLVIWLLVFLNEKMLGFVRV